MSILLVEDDLELRSVLHDLLYDDVQNILLASNGLEALDMYKENSFDIVLSDFKMPFVDGLEMSKQIRQINPEQYIAFISAHAQIDIVLTAINMQINKFITKPIIDFEIFLESLNNDAKVILEKNHIKYISEHDSLTSLYNRRRFNQLLEIEQKKVDKYDYVCSLIMLDLDFFKKINDTYGHLLGDTILKEFTQLIANNSRKIDLFARWGGEEFIIIIPELELEEAIKLANKLRKVVEDNIFSHNIKMTSSFGVTQLIKDYSLDSTISKVDNALYKSKNKGRNRVSSC